MEERRVPSSSAERGRRKKRELPGPRDFALRRLARRAHSEGELRDKMVRAGYPPASIEGTLEFLRARRYLDDASFAVGYARNASQTKHWGPARIEHRLRELKLADRHVELALAEVFPEGEEPAARRALERFRRTERLRPSRSAEQSRTRAYRRLLSRGFSPEVAYRLVSSIILDNTDVAVENENGPGLE